MIIKVYTSNFVNNNICYEYTYTKKNFKIKIEMYNSIL